MINRLQRFTKQEKYALLLALAIGDGYLFVKRDKRYPQSWHQRLQVKHSAQQREYINYKAELLVKLLGGKKPKVREINNNGYAGVEISKSNKWFRIIYKRLYRNGKKIISRKVLDKLTPAGIAIWYMDDGSLSYKKRDGKIHAREITLNNYATCKENKVIADYFKEKWNIHFTVVKSKSSTRLRCGTREGKKLIKLIEKYIIPSMQYKINMKY